MERVVYQQMAELDDRHWWYRARRRILAELIRREANPPAGAKILEIGCGTGHNLPMLGQFGRVDGLELDDEAAAIQRDVPSSHLRNQPSIPGPSLTLTSARPVSTEAAALATHFSVASFHVR